jgi:hypothetical protein
LIWAAELANTAIFTRPMLQIEFRNIVVFFSFSVQFAINISSTCHSLPFWLLSYYGVYNQDYSVTEIQ